MKVGDRVYLQTSSPEMTVVEVEGIFVKVMWFSIDNGVFSGPHQATFPAQALRTAKS